jgi:hypothetical protein
VRAWGTALLLGAAATLRAAVPGLSVTEIRSPSVIVPVAPALACDREGRAWLGWVQPSAGGQALFCADFQEPGGWGGEVFITSSEGARAPQLTASPDGRLASIWPERSGGFSWARSIDGGRSWESSGADWPCTAADGCVLASGDLLSAWAAPNAATIQVRFLTGFYAAAPAYTVVRDAAPANFQMRPLLDGGALLLYVAEAAPDRQAIASARLHGRRWVKGRVIPLRGHVPNSNKPAPPQAAEQPALAASLRFDVDGGRVAAVWAEAGRIYASYSPDAGARFSVPAVLTSSPAPSPAADVAMLHDTAAIVVYRIGGQVWVLRVSPEWDPGPPVPVLAAGAVGAPRIALVHDYAGAEDSASLVVAVRTAEPAALRTFLVRVPESRLLAAAADDCHCAPTPQQLLGYSVRGTVARLDLAARSLVLETDAVPGVMDAGEHVFTLGPSDRPFLSPGDECLGRIQRSGDGWRIFDLRRLETAK